LTAVATRFKRQDLLESAIEPSKVLSEQYMNTAILTKDGDTIVGRITEETPEKIVIRPNPLAEQTILVLKSDVEERSQSKVSPMPAGLLDTFSREDVLDLLAYIESLGDPNHPNFQK
jgi:putative heme-binding domain-containing protein